MKILITGASGFIGSALLQRLRADGMHQPIASTTRLTADADWSRDLHGVEAVLHCAARVHVMRESADNPLAAFRAVNVAGTVQLAQQAAAAGIKRFVFLSSIKVHGEQTAPGKPFTLADAPAPQDAYGQSKWEAEQALCAVGQRTGMEVVIIRSPLVYGPGVKGNFALLMELVRSGVPLPFASVDNLRSFIARDNLVDFMLHALAHPAAAHQTFLVSDHEDISTPALLRSMAVAMGVTPRLFSFPPALLHAGARMLGKRDIAQRLCGNLQVDSAHALHRLGWHPPLTLAEGLHRAVQACGNDCSRVDELL